MLPAANKAIGASLGFPDTCMTPAAPSPVPVPYPNIGLNAQAVKFSLKVKISMSPAMMQKSEIPMTSGMEAGSAHPQIKKKGKYLFGSPIVKIEKSPAVHLLCPTTGNNMNNPIGVVGLPSLVNVLYTLRQDPAFEASCTVDPYARPMSVDLLRELAEVTFPRGASHLPGHMLTPEIGYVRSRVLAADVSIRLFRTVRWMQGAGMKLLILDLRGNPGGPASTFVQLADDFLERDSVICKLRDADGDESLIRARRGVRYLFPLVILVDRATASAGELLAGVLQWHGRAIVVGAPTFGKSAAQTTVASSHGLVYRTVASFALPGGEEIAGGGVRPDINVALGTSRAGDDQLVTAIEVGRRWLGCARSGFETIANPL